MTVDILTRTACGLYVMPDGQPRGWSNFTWAGAVADEPGDAEELLALAMIGQDVMTQVGRDRAGAYVTPRDVAFAALHVGDVSRVEDERLFSADPEVEGYLIESDTRSTKWTVCGVLEGSWRTVCYAADADTARVAYFLAWEWCRDQLGAYLLLAAVHEGRQPPIEVFGYADPWARDEQAMAAKAAEWGVR